MKKWRVWCETESLHVTEWANAKPTACPNDGGHTITAAKTAILEDSKINDQTGTTYTLVGTDGDCYVRCTNAAAVGVTVPPNSSTPFPLRTEIAIHQGGAGQITLTEGSGVTINGDKKITGINKGCVLIKTGENTWDVHGSLEA